ncbi:uncharacterized protein HaLaN_25226, partial [Haematococcus lacustris]
MNSYSSLNSRRAIIAGVTNTSAALFTVETTSGQPFVNLTSDSFFLRSAGQYCRIQGSGSSAVLNCNTPQRSAAALLQMPYNSYYGVRLTSSLVNISCGAYQLELSDGAIPYVNCTVPRLAPSNFRTTYSLGLRRPGAASVVSGMVVGFKVFDTLYRYQVFNWVVQERSPYNVTLKAAGATDPTQWFVLEKVGALPGAIIVNGDSVAIKSATTSMYCGVGSAPANQLSCDQVFFDAPEPAYQFIISL